MVREKGKSRVARREQGSVSAYRRAFEPGRLNPFNPRSRQPPPTGEPGRCRTPGNGQGVAFVMRVIRSVVGMVDSGTLIDHRQFAASVLVHMVVRRGGGRWRDVERRRDGREAMGARVSN